MAAAFRLFDQACFAEHPAGRPIIGSRANIRRFERAQLAAWVQRQYTGVNTIVGVAGDVDADEIVAAAQAAFGDMQRGVANQIAAPLHVGGLRQRRLPSGDQAHVVVGFPIPPLAGEHQPYVVAAALLGEGMSSPLLDQLRERRGLVYHADCWTDVREAYGQFVIEASTPTERLSEFLDEVTRLLREHRESIDPIGLERARNQIVVRSLVDRESPAQRLELATLDLFALGRVRSRDEFLTGFAAIDAARVRDAFARMFQARAAVAIAGDISRAAAQRVAARVVQDEARTEVSTVV